MLNIPKAKKINTKQKPRYGGEAGRAMEKRSKEQEEMRSTQPNPNPSLSPNNKFPAVRVTRPLSVQEPEEKKEKIQDSDGVDAKAS